MHQLVGNEADVVTAEHWKELGLGSVGDQIVASL